MMETQADIIAGIMFVKFFQLQKRTFLLDFDTQNFQKLLNFVYKLGEDEFSIGTHPSFSQRRNAFRLGIAYGIFYSQNSEEIRKTIDSVLIVSPEEDFINWSLNLAKVINRNPNSLYNQIQTISIPFDNGESTVWDTFASNPIVIYHERIVNTSKHNLQIHVQIKVIGADRELNDPLYNDLQGSAKNYIMDLKPQQSYDIIDTLDWSKVSNNKYHPRLITPEDPECLILIVPIGGDEDFSYDNNCSGTSIYAHTPKRNPKLDFSDALNYLNTESLSNFEYLKSGLGSGVEDDDFISFNSKYQFPNSMESTIEVWKEYGNISYSAIMAYQETKSDLDSIYLNTYQELLNLEEQGVIEFLELYEPKLYDEPRNIGDTVTYGGIKVFFPDNFERVRISDRNIERELSFRFLNSSTHLLISYNNYLNNEYFSQIKLKITPNY